MYHAKDRRTGQLIGASKASPWGNYRCPTCNVEVFLRSGDYRVAHFAHKPGQGKPECDEFHPSDELTHSWRDAPNYQGPAIDPLKLNIELEPERNARHGFRRWGLTLTVPKSSDDHGVIQIDLGGGDIRRIPLSRLVLGPQTYRADIATEDFGATWISPDVRAHYRAAIEHRIPGLSKRVANVFTADSRAKLKPQTKALHWGESYYFVWPEDLPIAFPEELLDHPLASNVGWRCALVVLPSRSDPAIETWLTHTCDLPMVRPKKEWALLYPPFYSIDDEGTLLLPSTSQIFLAIKPVDGSGGTENEISCVAGEVIQRALMSGTDRHLIEIKTSDQTSRKHVSLRWDDSYLATVVAKQYPDSAGELSVLLRFDGAESVDPIALHHSGCHELLKQVRMGRRRIVEVTAPPTLIAEICWKSSDELEWLKEELVFASVAESANCPSLETAKLDRINAILQDRLSDIRLEFGPYGAFYSPRSLLQRRDLNTFKIGRDLRARVEWLCKASGTFVAPRQKPLAKLDDRALLQLFSKVTVPRALLAHRRALDREIQNATKALRS